MSREKRRVLVVEDDVEIQQMLYTFLEDDYEVQQALTGEDGLTLLQQMPPDIILLDIKMEPMNGYQFVDEIAKRGLPDVPILIMTAFADVQQAAVDLLKQKNSVFDIAVKPFKYIEYITTCIERVIAQQKQDKAEAKKEAYDENTY